MDEFSQYIGVFTQAPLAVILLVFMYLVLKQQSLLITKLTDLIEIQTKIIKQQERNDTRNNNT